MKKNPNLHYDFKLAVKRILMVFLFLIFVIASINHFFLGDEVNDFEEEEMSVYERNSRGDLYSLNESIQVQGELSVEYFDENILIKVSNFKITNKESIGVFLATHPRGSGLSEIRVLDTNIGTLNFNISSKHNLELQKYLIFKDLNTNKVIAYGELS